MRKAIFVLAISVFSFACNSGGAPATNTEDTATMQPADTSVHVHDTTSVDTTSVVK